MPEDDCQGATHIPSSCTDRSRRAESLWDARALSICNQILEVAGAQAAIKTLEEHSVLVKISSSRDGTGAHCRTEDG